MKSIQGLFAETKNDINHDHADRMARRYRYLPSDCASSVPKVNYPSENSKHFKEDFEEVLRCHNNPSMTTNFLRDSDDSVEEIFKRYCKENDYRNINWKKLSDAIEDVDTVVLKLKYENNRPRPIHYLQDVNSNLDIKYKKSPSFPSGHTAIAYFLCDTISNSIPELRQDLQTLASLVGQSRIENAVHFPTDVEYGRLVGETLADLFMRQDRNKIDKSLAAKNYKQFAEKLRSRSESKPRSIVRDVADFICRTCEIENFYVNYSECVEAVKYLIAGIPPRRVTNNPHIISQIDGLVMANKLGKIDNNHKVCNIHKCFNQEILERGTPGEFRNFSHKSRSGVQYPEPYTCHQHLKNCHKYADSPWLRHLIYEYIHPFCDGNGRSGRIILAADLDFDFKKVNTLIDESYLNNIIGQMKHEDMIKFL